jgi:hypothetical protein
VTVDYLLPLLDSLRPLACCVLPECAESVRALIRTALMEIVAELGYVSGPRIQRVTDYFDRLVGRPKQRGNVGAEPCTAEKVRGALGTLRERYAFSRKHVLSVEDERQLTNFESLVESVCSLRLRVEAFKTRSAGDTFLGTQLIRLSQQLNVIVESVQEAYDAMDSVFFGPEEREVTEIKGTARITVAGLLGWIEHFASVEARQLIEDAGKDGVNSVAYTLKELKELMDLAVKTKDGNGNVAQAFGVPRVTESMRALQTYVVGAYEIANSVDIADCGESKVQTGGQQRQSRP